jgi:hypothetical protein
MRGGEGGREVNQTKGRVGPIPPMGDSTRDTVHAARLIAFAVGLQYFVEEIITRLAPATTSRLNTTNW